LPWDFHIRRLLGGKKVCYIVMNHSVPLWKVEPVAEEDDLIDQLILAKYAKEIDVAREQVRRGESYSTKELKKHLGL
jgi:hypothetical protein